MRETNNAHPSPKEMARHDKTTHHTLVTIMARSDPHQDSFIQPLLDELKEEIKSALAMGKTLDEALAALDEVFQMHPHGSELESLYNEQRRIIRGELGEHRKKLFDDAQAFVRSLRVASNPSIIAQLASDISQDAAENALRNSYKFDILLPAYPWLRQFVFNETRTLRQKWYRKRKVFTFVTDVFDKKDAHLSETKVKTFFYNEQRFLACPCKIRGSLPQCSI